MKTNNAVDTARLSLLLNELRLPAIEVMWSQFAEQADKEGWPAARFLAAIAEHELAERDRRRIERHLAEARLLPGKTLDTFEFEAVPMISKAQVMAITAGDTWLEKGANLLLFGPPGSGKSHLASAIGLALIENGWRVMFTRTTDLVQKLQVARRELGLEAAINRLDRFHLLILDDLAYVTRDQAETSVLFELISTRYERGSMLITANQPFGEWGKVFPDPAMTLAAVGRLVHHATIFEMNVESYWRREAMERKRGPGRPHTQHPPISALIDAPRQSMPRSSPPPRHRILIQIVARLSSRLSRYNPLINSVIPADEGAIRPLADLTPETPNARPLRTARADAFRVGGCLLPQRKRQMAVCPLHMPVAVREYPRFRFGRWEHVRSHCRSQPRRQLRRLLVA
jgi:DNA replication protein DnaC